MFEHALQSLVYCLPMRKLRCLNAPGMKGTFLFIPERILGYMQNLFFSPHTHAFTSIVGIMIR